jgi:hypothetical protein
MLKAGSYAKEQLGAKPPQVLLVMLRQFSQPRIFGLPLE